MCTCVCSSLLHLLSIHLLYLPLFVWIAREGDEEMQKETGTRGIMAWGGGREMCWKGGYNLMITMYDLYMDGNSHTVQLMSGLSFFLFEKQNSENSNINFFQLHFAEVFDIFSSIRAYTASSNQVDVIEMWIVWRTIFILVQNKVFQQDLNSQYGSVYLISYFL